MNRFKSEIQLLTVLLVFVIFSAFIAVKIAPNDRLLEWLLGTGSAVLGGLLMLIQMTVKELKHDQTTTPPDQNNGPNSSGPGGNSVFRDNSNGRAEGRESNQSSGPGAAGNVTAGQ